MTHLALRRRWCVALALSVLCALSAALYSQAAAAGDDFLEPERAFKASARVAGTNQVDIEFDVAPGYYLYRERFAVSAPGATLGVPKIPAGTLKFDETFKRKLETHRGRIRIEVPIKQAPARFRLSVTYQGCADRGLCYPPAQLDVDVSLAAFGGNATALPVTQAAAQR